MLNEAVQYPRRRVQTGVFPVARLAHSTATPEELARTVRALVEPSLAAVLVMPTPAMPAKSAVTSNNGTDYELTPDLLSWVGNTRQTALVEVPVALRRPLMCFRALVVPVATPFVYLGVVIVPAAQPSERLIASVEDQACDFALRLELVQRDQTLAALAESESDEAPVSSAPPCNVLLAPQFVPASRRIA